MADANIKKVIFTQEQLNALSSGSTTTFRYRIISEDKTRISAWSPFYTIPHKPISELLGSKNVHLAVTGTTTLSITWDEVGGLNLSAYDLYAQYSGDSDYLYIGTIPYNSTATGYTFTYKVPTGFTVTAIKLQAYTTTKTVYANKAKTIFSDQVIATHVL